MKGERSPLGTAAISLAHISSKLPPLEVVSLSSDYGRTVRRANQCLTDGLLPISSRRSATCVMPLNLPRTQVQSSQGTLRVGEQMRMAPELSPRQPSKTT